MRYVNKQPFFSMQSMGMVTAAVHKLEPHSILYEYNCILFQHTQKILQPLIQQKLIN